MKSVFFVCILFVFALLFIFFTGCTSRTGSQHFIFSNMRSDSCCEEQSADPDPNVSERYDFLKKTPRKNSLSILFWNLENLFHPEDDPEKDDDEFTAEGERKWSFSRYRDKIKGIWKTILSVEGMEAPEIIAVCEIENAEVMEDLFVRSPFGYLGYDYVHKDSPDVRGIDVGLAYNKRVLTLIDSAFYEVDLNGTGRRPTRLILSSVFVSEKDTIYLFINHWPSKYGGAGATEPLRLSAASKLRELTDSISNLHHNAKIICAGDFNDTHNSRSISGVLCEKGHANDLILLNAQSDKVMGTTTYKGIWMKIDHFIVSESLLNARYGYYTDSLSCEIIAHDFLLERDESRGGIKPRRTWIGYSYNGGLSDHLPVLLKLYMK